MELKVPNSRRNLDNAIMRTFGRENYLRVRTAMANVIAAQMMPEGTVKGGTAMKVRFGDAGTRFSEDLDAARSASMEVFAERYAKSLASGWAGFTGRLVEERAPHPAGVPEAYVMRPYDIKLSYKGGSWVTVRLEVGHNEIGDADDPDWGIADEIASYFPAVGLPTPEPLPLMPLHHQVAQKLHALTTSGSMRAHDLVDLQILFARGDVDFSLTKDTCVRLFAYRKAQSWPPTVVAADGWNTIYQEERVGTCSLESVDDAVRWANDLIKKID